MFGGAERTTHNLLEHLNRDLFTHTTLVAPDILKQQLPLSYDAYIDSDHYGLLSGFNNPQNLLKAARQTSRLLSEEQPDIALGMMHYPSALLAFGAKLGRSRSKIVASFRGPFYEYLRHQEKTFQRKLFLHSAVTGTALLADRIIVPSHGTGRELQRHFLGRRRKTVTIPNGIDQQQAWQAARQPVFDLEFLENGRPLICAAARLAPEKNLDFLLLAFRSVTARKPVHLLILGDGPERPALETLVSDWGIADAVTFLGFRENIEPYLHRASLFIHTCQFEGFGYTMLEAMAVGTTVIATDCPYGPREVLGDNEFGLLTSPTDPNALADAIVHLLDDEAARRRYSLLGLERAKALSVQRMVQAYEAVFQSLAAT